MKRAWVTIGKTPMLAGIALGLSGCLATGPNGYYSSGYYTATPSYYTYGPAYYVPAPPPPSAFIFSYQSDRYPRRSEGRHYRGHSRHHD